MTRSIGSMTTEGKLLDVMYGSPIITCCRCKAEQVEEAHNVSFHGRALEYAVKHYGTAHFRLCDKCTVETYAGLFGVEAKEAESR